MICYAAFRDNPQIQWKKVSLENHMRQYIYGAIVYIHVHYTVYLTLRVSFCGCE